LSSEQIKNVGKVLEDNSEKVYKSTKERLNNGVYDNCFNVINFRGSSWSSYDDVIENKTEISYNEFLSLFEKEWQPKQGDKVFVSSNGIDFDSYPNPFIYVMFFEDMHYVKPLGFKGVNLVAWKFIKPFKEEKNWYRIKEDKDFYFIKLSEEDTLNYKVQDCEVVKITNPQLIEFLENEIK